MRRALYFWAVVLLVVCHATVPLRMPPVYALSQDEEIRISRQFRREARRQLKFIEDPEVELYADRIGRRVLEAVGNIRYPYRFFVIEDSSLNAFAVPGGSIFLHSGLIQRVRSTDELASVIAHEIVHVNARHFHVLASSTDVAMLVGMLGVFLAPVIGPAALAGPAVAMSRQLEFSRQMEEQADNLGIGYLAGAGYDPQAAVTFMRRMYHDRLLNPVGRPAYLLTHPLTDKRIANLSASIRAQGLSAPRFRDVDDIQRVKLLIELRDEPETVVERLRKEHESRPTAAMPAYSLGLAYAATGRWVQARDMLERAARLNPAVPNLHRDLGRVYLHTEEISKAHAALDRMLERQPEDPISHLYQGRLFEKESRFRDAARAYLKARQFAPFWPEAARRLGYAYRKLNQPGKAHYYLAQSYLLRDETGKAIDALERAAQQYAPDSPRLEVIKDEIAAIRAGG
ncbi:MAG: tetratricopeptide repeat protein [Deltaproteobacteria bacterium]|nr:tetratricopeptide repeat protein [Deltaproteobacteria bacterium]